MDKKELREFLKHKDLREIWIEIDDILSSGFTIDEILDLGEPYELFFTDYFEKILDLGSDPEKLFKINEPQYIRKTGYFKELCGILMVYLKHGLSRSFIKDWLEANIHPEVFVLYSEEFRPFGIDPDDYVGDYLDNHKISFDLPPSIKIDDILHHFSIDEIKDEYIDTNSVCYHGFGVFVSDFIKAGGSVKILANKFLAEKGYPENEDDLMALTVMLNKGATQINANKIIDSLTKEAYSSRSDEAIKNTNFWFYEMLEDYADNHHLQKLVN